MAETLSGDIGFSSREHGFESRRGYKPALLLCYFTEAGAVPAYSRRGKLYKQITRKGDFWWAGLKEEKRIPSFYWRSRNSAECPRVLYPRWTNK